MHICYCCIAFENKTTIHVFLFFNQFNFSDVDSADSRRPATSERPPGRSQDSAARHRRLLLAEHRQRDARRPPPVHHHR